MAQVLEDKKTVTVRVTHAELSNLLVQPAKDLGFIDFDPSRINISEVNGGSAYNILFEKVVAV